MDKNMDKIINYINEGNYFLVTSHVNPDGDNIGSTLSMYYYLKSINKEVYYVLDDDTPINLKFLLEDIEILSSEEFIKLNLEEFNLIALDCGDLNRICIDKTLIENAKKLICIDHHASNDNYGDFNYVVPEESSTCELVYNLFKKINEKENTQVIDKKIATALYTGVVTDTGKFTYSNTHPSTFDMAKDLLILGAETNKVICEVYGNNPYNYYKLLGEALNTLDIINTKIAVITLTQDMLSRNHVSFKDTDGITPYCRDIENVEVGILVKEKSSNEIKISLRSKNYVDVSHIAKMFNGGGHVRAAGLTVFNETIENATKMVVAETLKYI
ncbi:bifunctional oligoribonuclease/PAP phosphatase NrnA [Intestinibacter bartlettii]|uniref:Bifunctional oligoribonuclease/PAP phosphatase NrnA n=2 Tax=Intestinibacter bartlettii TaxID=261299 RepID=A0ABS6DT84_9FIRM|nr:bifunctional oligoribonuclease/PAP phosphatase NrnA [Intestinibacter bartlettii]